MGSNKYELIGTLTGTGARRRRNLVVVATAVFFVGAFSLALKLDSMRITSILRTPCNPYAQHGRLIVDEGNPHANRWHPFGSGNECTQPGPALAAAFLRASWANTPPSKGSSTGNLWADEEVGPDGRPWSDVSWAQNRTVLYLGDSVARYKTAYLCEMAGEELIELNWTHPWSPPQIFKDGSTAPSAPGYEGMDPFGWHKLPPGEAHTHIGHYCYVPGLDFLLVHLHSYGLDQEGYFEDRDSYFPPYTFEERLHGLAVPWIQAIRDSKRRTESAPELIYLHSALWDAMRWAKEDMNSPVGDNEERLGWYRHRIREATLATADAFPKAALYWSTTHYPIRPSTGWFFPGVEPHKRPELKLLRLAEMQAAALSAFDSKDVPRDVGKVLGKVKVNWWGTAVVGQEEHQVDDLHPSFLPSGYLWADMMLYDLRDVVA
ncbi:hypothetical protein CspHIS471_0207000 [Cutaneotrichosporon sp. HIS471]|nr:hypothetical protein CspHIS471_0207000 [Cutaneotrichosporon sp. HIS471]